MQYDKELNQIFADYLDEEFNFDTLLRVLPSAIIPKGTVFVHRDKAHKRWLFQTLEELHISIFSARRTPIFVEPGSIYPLYDSVIPFVPYNNTIEPVTCLEFNTYMKGKTV